MNKSTALISLALLGAALAPSSTWAETVSVQVFKPELAKHFQSLSLSGSIEASQSANLAALQSGVVAQLYAEQGDQVSRGQKLMELDATLAKLTLSQMRAKVKVAQTQTEEAERLYREVVELSQKQLVAATTMAERLSTMQVAKAQLAQANAELEHQVELVNRHVLYAPFSGVIGERNIDLGEWVTQQTNVFTLIGQENLRVNIAIPQEYFSQLQGNKNTAVTIYPDSVSSNPIEAKLDRLVAAADNTTRTVTALVDLPPYTGVIAGMSASVNINIPASDQAMLWLPKTAIKQHPDGGRSVFSANNGKAQRHLVKVVKQQGERVAVTGAPVDMVYVVSGVELLKQGDKITIDGAKP